jgi:hypothetical protein
LPDGEEGRQRRRAEERGGLDAEQDRPPGNRSATALRARPRANMGSARQKPTRPTAKGEPVRSRAAQPATTFSKVLAWKKRSA